MYVMSRAHSTRTDTRVQSRACSRSGRARHTPIEIVASDGDWPCLANDQLVTFYQTASVHRRVGPETAVKSRSPGSNDVAMGWTPLSV
jgi:hypothetical protein